MRTYSVDAQEGVSVKPKITGISPSRGVVGTVAAPVRQALQLLALDSSQELLSGRLRA